MANRHVRDLTEETAPDPDDLLYVETTDQLPRKVKVSTLRDLVPMIVDAPPDSESTRIIEIRDDTDALVAYLQVENDGTGYGYNLALHAAGIPGNNQAHASNDADSGPTASRSDLQTASPGGSRARLQVASFGTGDDGGNPESGWVRATLNDVEAMRLYRDAATGQHVLSLAQGDARFEITDDFNGDIRMGFFGATPVNQPTVTSYPSLQAALEDLGLIAPGTALADPLARANHTGTQTLSTISDAGTLAGLNTVASAQITDGTIVNGDISASAAIALSKLATDPLARANHTGTQLAATISDLSTAAYVPGGTDVPVVDGGTGSSTAAGARTNLGLVIGTDVEAHDADLTTIAGLTPSNDDILQRKAGAWANRTIAQLLTDLAALGTTFQPLDSDLTAIAALSTTSFGRSLLAAADAAALRTLAGTVIGTDVQAYDAELAALAGLTSAANKVPYFTGSGTAAVADLTAAGRALIDDADASAQRTTLGLVIGTDVAAIASPTFTGDPKAPTATFGDNDTSLATTAFVQSAAGLFVRKTSDETVTSSTTLQDDNELALALVATGTYVFEAVLYFDGSTSGDINFAFTSPASSTLMWQIIVAANAATAAPSAVAGAVAVGSGTGAGVGGAVGAGTKMPALIHGTVITAGTSGNLQLQWAQRVSDGTASTVFTGSYMTARRVA